MRRSRPLWLLPCRLRVVEASSQAPVIQSNTRTACLSTGNSPRNDTAHASTTRAISKDAVHPEPFVRKVAQRRGQRLVPGMWAAQAKSTGEQHSPRLDALFRQVVQEQTGLQGAADDDKSLVPDASDLTLLRAIGKLEEMIDGDAPVADAYHYFQTQIMPATQVPDVYVPKSYDKVILAMLDRLVAAKEADMFSEKLPSVADIFQIYAQVGRLNPKQWAILVRELVQCIVNVDPSTEARSTASQEAMLLDLIESWKVLSIPQFAAPTTVKNETTNTFWFPALDKYALRKLAGWGGFPSAFSASFPKYQANQLGASVATLAIATLVLLHDKTRCPLVVRDRASRFISRLSSIITFVDYQDRALQRDLIDTLPSLEKYVIGLWPNVKAYLREIPMTEGELSAEAHTAPDSTIRLFNATMIQKRLHQIQWNINFRELDKLWIEFVGSEEPMSEDRVALIRQHTDIIDLFIKIRMKFRQPDMALTAWALLGKIGLKPSLKTWNMMLDGLRQAGNIAGLKNIWRKVTLSGLKLDTPIWTTRIGGLIECGDIEGGLEALQEMATLWDNNPNSNVAVMPTIEPVNAALVALFRRKRRDAAERLLAWAGGRGIKPDIYTYNTMLGSLVRGENQDADIEALFADMQAQGVQANEITYTILLDTCFEIRDPKTQEKIITDVLAAMRAAGLSANMQTYGKMIYLLLRANATSKAMAIVNDLHNRNLDLSPHIYTMLVQNCFGQSPPDVEYVRQLVQRRRRHDFNEMDRVFYDRVAGGFIWAGEVDEALDIFDYVVGAGGCLNLPTVDALVTTLLRLGFQEQASRVARREKERFESTHPDSENHTQYWGHGFWQMARRNNLLDP